MSEELEEYRKHLLEAGQKAQEDFDKTVIALSSGALGVSFAFIGNVIRHKPIIAPHFLFYAWWSWAASLGVVLVSYYLSVRALREALRQAYDGSIYFKRPGGFISRLISVANAVGGLLFFLGLYLLAEFIRRNLR
jgi:hypothetical protein